MSLVLSGRTFRLSFASHSRSPERNSRSPPSSSNPATKSSALLKAMTSSLACLRLRFRTQCQGRSGDRYSCAPEVLGPLGRPATTRSPYSLFRPVVRSCCARIRNTCPELLGPVGIEPTTKGLIVHFKSRTTPTETHLPYSRPS